MPKVSIWLTSYNHGELLRQSIESVLNQTFQDYELIIVDDCSTDNSQDIIREYARKCSKIRMVFHEKNMGTSGMQYELDNFAGEYVAILCGDDKWREDKLQKQVEVLDHHKNITACFTGVQAIGLDGNAYFGDQVSSRVFRSENRTRYEWLNYFFYNSNCLCHPSLLIRKEAYQKYGLLTDGLLISLPDFYEWVKLCFYTDIYILPEELTLFRIHDDETSQSGETEEKLNRLFLEEYFVYQTYLSINDMQTLTGVFPQSREYVRNGECVIKFALAKIFTEAPRQSQRLLGLNTICELLQDEESKRRIEELYGYGAKEFNQEKQRYDIFGNLSRERFLMTALYVDTGNGYNEKECIRKKIFIPNTGLARIICDLQEAFPKKEIKRIRFDLDEDLYRNCSVVKAEWENGKTAKIRPVNGVREKGRDYFYTLDPQYEIKPEGHNVLYLILKVGVLSTTEVERYREAVADEVRTLKEAQLSGERYRLLLEEYRASILIRIVHRLRKKILRQRR